MKDRWCLISGAKCNLSKMSKGDLVRLIMKLLEEIEKKEGEFNK